MTNSSSSLFAGVLGPALDALPAWPILVPLLLVGLPALLVASNVAYQLVCPFLDEARQPPPSLDLHWDKGLLCHFSS